MSKGRKCKKKKGGSYSWCCDGREVSWASQGLWPINKPWAMRTNLLTVSIANSHPLFLFPLSFFFLWKQKHLESHFSAYGSFMSLFRWGTEQNFKKKKTLMSTLHLKDARHEILNIVCTEVTLFCPPHRYEHYFVFKLISFAKGPELFLVRVAPVWVCCFPTIFQIL